jgi:hypothetical protein
MVCCWSIGLCPGLLYLTSETVFPSIINLQRGLPVEVLLDTQSTYLSIEFHMTCLSGIGAMFGFRNSCVQRTLLSFRIVPIVTKGVLNVNKAREQLCFVPRIIPASHYY